MKTVRIYQRPYNVNNYEPKLIAEYKVKNVYESSFYFRPVPTLSAKRCREILNTLCPNSKLDKELVICEWVDSGYTWLQTIYRKGTILIG